MRNSRDNSYSGSITPRSPPTHHLSHLRVARQLGPRLAPILPLLLDSKSVFAGGGEITDLVAMVQIKGMVGFNTKEVSHSLNKRHSTVSSSAERGIMCDKILSPDTLNVDMGDFV